MENKMKSRPGNGRQSRGATGRAADCSLSSIISSPGRIYNPHVSSLLDQAAVFIDRAQQAGNARAVKRHRRIKAELERLAFRDGAA